MARVPIKPHIVEACQEFHQTIVTADTQEIGLVLVAREILDRFRKKGQKLGKIELNVPNATKICNDFLTEVLLADQFEAGAALMWGPDAFTWEPESTRMVWEDLFEQSQELVMGAGSMGKTYSAGGWFYCDWRCDPQWTTLKVMSVTQEHAKRNIFAHMRGLHDSSVIPMPGSNPLAESIQANTDDRHGIHLVTIPQGDNGKGRLRGFHPIPRPGAAHKKFGRLTRVRLVLDEAEVIPGGVWEDVDNLLLSEDHSEDPGRVMIFGATNPKDPASKFGQRAEPKQGYDGPGHDIDTSIRWISRMGWHVLRIDGARCENVIQKRIVYKGLMTYDGFMRFLANGGANTAAYFTMARGWFPPQGVAQTAIPAHAIKRAVGMYRFVGAVRHCISCDQAFEGEDKYVVTLGRTGSADGWTDRDNKFHKFMRRYGMDGEEEAKDDVEQVRNVLQIDQQIEFPKLPTLEQTHAIMKFCKMMHVNPAMVALDRTGNGTGVYDNLRTLFKDKTTGMSVLGVHFGEAATEMPILEDDSEKASELYDGIVTELIYALGRFMEFDYVKFSPSFSHVEVMTECGRRWAWQKKMKLRVESKKEFKNRTQLKSPDRMDSASILVHLVRNRAKIAGAMLPGAMKPKVSQDMIRRHSAVDAIEFVDMSQD